MNSDPKVAAPQTNTRPLSSNILDTTVASMLLMILTFLSGILLSRLLGPEGRGAYGAVHFCSQLLVGLLSVSFFEAAMVRIRNRPETEQVAALPLLGIFGIAVVCLISVIVAVAFIWGAFDAFLSILPLFAYLVVLLSGIILATSVFATYEVTHLNFRRLNIERVITPLIFLTAVPALMLFSVTNPAIAILAYAGATMPVLVYRILRYRRELVGRVDGILFNETARVARRFYVELGLTTLSREADRLILVVIWSAERLGYYFVAFSAGGATLSIFLQGIRLVLLPNLTGIEDDVRRDRTERLLRISVIFAIITVIFILIAAPFLIPLAFGTDFTPAIPYLQGMIIPMSLTPIMTVITASARSKETSAAGIQMALASLAVFSLGYWATRFIEPYHLFTTMTFANLTAICLGLRQLKSLGIISIRSSILPHMNDIMFVRDRAIQYIRRS